MSKKAGSVKSVSKKAGSVKSVSKKAGSVKSVSKKAGSVKSVSKKSGSVKSISKKAVLKCIVYITHKNDRLLYFKKIRRTKFWPQKPRIVVVHG